MSIASASLRKPKPPGQDGGWRMVASEGFAEFLREQLTPLGHVTMRRMFGKTGVFCNGLMFGMVADNTLYFRVDDQNRGGVQGGRVRSVPQRREERAQHRPRLLARAGAAVRRSRWACHVGAGGAGGGAPGRGGEGTSGATANIKAATGIAAGPSLVAAPSLREQGWCLSLDSLPGCFDGSVQRHRQSGPNYASTARRPI